VRLYKPLTIDVFCSIFNAVLDTLIRGKFHD
jgi:hypothetical protein